MQHGFDLATLGLTAEDAARVAETARATRADALAACLRTTGEEAVATLAQAAGLPFLPLPVIDEEALAQLPPRLLTDFACIPVKTTPEDRGEGELALATPWPPEDTHAEWVYAVTGRDPRWYLAPPGSVVGFLTARFGVGFSSLDSEVVDVAPPPAEEAPEDGDAAVIRFVNELIAQAIADEATDIHLEPQEVTLRIRYRIDGILVQVPMPENLRRYQEAIISRLKIMAHLNISERRLPQDGRINFKLQDRVVDIRISTIPTIYAESVSLRLLNNKREPLTLTQLGLLPEQQAIIDRVLTYPHGIVLVTGPTGSGKSTSLNSFISKINSPDRRIITVEDPIEYEVPGVNQMQVRPEIGLDFAGALRHILRQDPDVIMVGEIRDRETADIAIRASLTGHLVFSTLHTNDAAGALTRLVDMGIEPFLVASAVELVLAQRLVRRLCVHCHRPSAIDPVRLADSLRTLGISASEAASVDRLMSPVGCPRCRGLGFRGRIGIFEILRVDDRLHDLVLARESSHAFNAAARAAGMRTMQQSGWEHVRAGTTTLEEVIGATALEI